MMADEVADLPEHLSNPFCAVLGPPPSLMGCIDIVERKPAFDASERALPPHLRRYCVLRLFDDGYVFPQTRQLQLVDRINMAIRNGYKNRNPAHGGYRGAKLDAVGRVEARDLETAGPRVGSSAVGLTLIGQPGLGKSLTAELALAAIPMTARPAVSDHVVQVPWLKIDCPTKATRKQVCLEFFEALDRRLGQDTYRTRYGRVREASPVAMLLDVQLLCQIHAVGLLVVDEIQNLNRSPEGPEVMMAFLVLLVNTIGVPVFAIGTMEADKVIGLAFRQARRSLGLHAPVWLRSTRDDADWNSLVDDLWQYQWTAEHAPLTDDLRAALYDHSQGIVDVLVKLVVLAQFRVILLGEVPNPSMVGSADPLWRRGRRREVITTEVLADVAREDMHPIQPMIAALREGREDVLERWQDLKGFHDYVADVVGRHVGRSVEGYREARARAEAELSAAGAAPTDALAPVRAFLRTRGMAVDLVEETLRRAVEIRPDADAFTILDAVREILDGAVPTPAPAVPAFMAVPAASASRRAATPRTPRPKPAPGKNLPPDDLRAIVARGRAAGGTAHTSLLDAGVVVRASEVGVT